MEKTKQTRILLYRLTPVRSKHTVGFPTEKRRAHSRTGGVEDGDVRSRVRDDKTTRRGVRRQTGRARATPPPPPPPPAGRPAMGIPTARARDGSAEFAVTLIPSTAPAASRERKRRTRGRPRT